MTAYKHIGGSVIFVDPCAPRAYTPSCIDKARLGGTEATLLKIATALSRRARIVVHQKHRRETAAEGRIQYRPFENARSLRRDADHIVVINSWKVALSIRKAHPDVPISLWLHVIPGRHNRDMGLRLRNAGIPIVCVSESHAASLRAFLRSADSALPEIMAIHNPVADDLMPDSTVRDANLLLFASAPHKGLSEVLQIFQTIRLQMPSLRLEIADPGYLAWRTCVWPQGTRALGKLSHAALMTRMRSALCLFYPQTSFAETFGLVIAEANAVGTPALLHAGLGANEEVASSTEQCVDGSDPEAVAATIRQWQNRFPIISGQARFRLAAVVERWWNHIEPRSAVDVPDHETVCGRPPF